jgi:hypothetical protein
MYIIDTYRRSFSSNDIKLRSLCRLPQVDKLAETWKSTVYGSRIYIRLMLQNEAMLTFLLKMHYGSRLDHQIFSAKICHTFRNVVPYFSQVLPSRRWCGKMHVWGAGETEKGRDPIIRMLLRNPHFSCVN